MDSSVSCFRLVGIHLHLLARHMNVTNQEMITARKCWCEHQGTVLSLDGKTDMTCGQVNDEMRCHAGCLNFAELERQVLALTILKGKCIPWDAEVCNNSKLLLSPGHQQGCACACLH